jgi:hypothetical protein
MSAMDSTASATGPSEPLTRLAAAHGVATDYWDWQGRHAPISAETIVAVLAALGVPADTPEEVEASCATSATGSGGGPSPRPSSPRGVGAVDLRARS